MKKIILLVSILVLFGCSVNPSELSPKYAKEMANKITYTRDDRTGLCFAVIASRKTGTASQSGLGMTVVPCEAVEHLIKD